MLISVCLTSDIRLRAPLVAQGTRPILAATSEDRFAARAALSPRSSLLWDGFLSLFTGPPPQKHLQIWTAKTGTFLFELCWAFSCNPCTRWNAGGRQHSVITSRTANRGKKKKYPRRWNPGPNGIRRNVAVYMNGARIIPLAKMIRPWSLSIHLLLFSASNKHSKKIKKYQRSWLCYKGCFS